MRNRTNQTALNTDLALSLALEAARTLHAIAVDGRTVYAVGRAERALTTALASDSEELQIAVAAVLAHVRTSSAQASLAQLGLDAGQADSLRISALHALTASAKNNGNLLEKQQLTELVQIARDEPDLKIRTAASQALGSLNLAINEASEIVRSYYGG